MFTSGSDRRQARHTRRGVTPMFMAALGLGGFALVLSACSSSATATSSSSTGTSTSTSTSTYSITVGENEADPGHSPLYVAIKNGYFAKLGLNVKVEEFLAGGAQAMWAATASGQVQINDNATTNDVGAIATKEASGKMFAEMQDELYTVISKKSITSINQLVGKKLGISGVGNADYVTFLDLLKERGISPSKVTFVSIGGPTDRLAALKAGSVDAIVDTADLQSEYGGFNTLVPASQVPVQFPSVFFADSNLIDNHPNVLKEFVKGLTEAAAWIKDGHIAQAAQDCSAQGGGTVALCQSAITFDANVNDADIWTWSSTFALNRARVLATIPAQAISTPQAKGLTLNDVADFTIAGDSTPSS